jgi:hypothetical protein
LQSKIYEFTDAAEKLEQHLQKHGLGIAPSNMKNLKRRAENDDDKENMTKKLKF